MALPVLNAYHLEGLQMLLATVETPAVLVVHGVASLTEALEVYSLADAAARERGWEVQALPNLARLAGVATEFDGLTTSLLPSLVADPSRKRDLLLLRSLALSVRHDVRRLDCAGLMRLRVDPVTNRLARIARRVISGQIPPASLVDLLPPEALKLGDIMRGYYFPIEQGPPPRIAVHNLADLEGILKTTDGRAELVIHGVANLKESLGMYDNAAAVARDRGWIISGTGLTDLARLASLAVEVDRLIADLLPQVIANPSILRNVFALKNAASSVRNLAGRLNPAGEFRLHLDPPMDRVLGAVRHVIGAQAAPALLDEVLPTARDEINACTTAYYIPLPGLA